jgi:hypothetical protein
MPTPKETLSFDREKLRSILLDSLATEYGPLLVFVKAHFPEICGTCNGLGRVDIVTNPKKCPTCGGLRYLMSQVPATVASKEGAAR